MISKSYHVFSARADIIFLSYYSFGARLDRIVYGIKTPFISQESNKIISPL